MAGIRQRYRMARARKRFMPTPSLGGPGPLSLVVLLAVIAVVLYVASFDRRGRERAARRLDLVRAAATDPLDLVVAAGRTHRIVILGDVLGADAPKRFAANAIEALARGPGLDVVALEIDAAMQSRIDAYLEARDEDASALLASSRATREWEGNGRTYLEIYRRVRALNAELGAARRIRILALDAPGWPPSPPPSPARMAQAFADRADHMAQTLEQRGLGRDDRARVFVLVDGLQALRARARIRTGGQYVDSLPLLTARLEAGTARRPFSILVAAPAPPAPPLGLTGYRAGPLYDQLARAAPGGRFGFAVMPDFEPDPADIGLWRGPGISVELIAETGTRPLFDAWVRLPG